MSTPRRYGVIFGAKALRKVGEYRDSISGSPKEDVFEEEFARLCDSLEIAPTKFREQSYFVEGPRKLKGSMCAGGLSLFWVRFIVYKKLPDPIVMVVDFGGR